MLMSTKNSMKFLLIPIVIIFSAAKLFAQGDALDVMPLQLNNMWLLIATFFMFFMQIGFVLLELGFIRAKNAANIIMKNLLDYSIGSIIFFVLGFVIMFGTKSYGTLGSL